MLVFRNGVRMGTKGEARCGTQSFRRNLHRPVVNGLEHASALSTTLPLCTVERYFKEERWQAASFRFNVSRVLTQLLTLFRVLACGARQRLIFDGAFTSESCFQNGHHGGNRNVA